MTHETNYFTPWIRVHLEKLQVAQLVKEFPAVCGMWRFITTFTGAFYWSISWSR